LGQISIQGSYTSLPDQDEYNIVIYLEAVNPDIWGFYVYDLILIPSDEWSCSISSASQSDTPMFYYGNGFDLDAIRNPRKYRSSLMQNVYVDEHWASKRYCELSRVASGEPVFQSNSDQRLWFFTYKEMPDPESFIENCGVIRAERSARYILMRGKN